MKKILAAILAGILVSMIFNGMMFFSENVSASTDVSGTINVNTTWTTSNSPYIVTGDVTVVNGTTLTINPGVTVKFDGLYSLMVNGTLNANGTQSQPINFTSNRSTPARGDWNRVRLHGKNNTLNYCQISYGSYPLYIMGENTNNSIRNCKIFNNSGDGIYLKKTTNNTIYNTTVYFSYSNGITLLASENNTIKNSFIYENRAFGIYLRSSKNNIIESTNVSENTGGGIELGLISNHIVMKNVTVYENEDNGIDLDGNGYNSITDSRIIGNDGAGIDLGGPSRFQWIENCVIKNNQGPGIDLKNSHYVNIVGCNISENSGSAGIYSASRVTNINITNSEIWSNTMDGINIYNANFIYINNSIISDNIWNGITFNGSMMQENNNIFNCTIARNGLNGINFYSYSDKYTSTVENNNISYNTIYSNSKNGIYFFAYSDIYNHYDPFVQNNHIYNNTICLNNQNGILFEVYSRYYYNYQSTIQYNNIYNNTIYLNNQNGIHFKAYHYDEYSIIQYNSVNNNTIFLNDQNGIRFSVYTGWDYGRIQYNNINHNSIYSNNKNGIIFDSDNYNRYILFQNNNIYYNTIYSNTENGIYFYCFSTRHFDLQYNNIYSNSIYSNGQNGIYLYGYCSDSRSNFQYNNIYSNLLYQNQKNGIYFFINSTNSDKRDPYYDGTFFQYNKIYSNTIYSNDENGIYYYGYAKNEFLYVQFNEIYSNNISNHFSGIGIRAETDNCKNTISQNSNVYNNTLIFNSDGIEFVSIKSHIVYINNISDNFNHGIVCDSSSGNTFSYNKIANNQGIGIELTSSSTKNKIQNNNLTSNAQTGIFINSNSNDNTITRNDILGHLGDGVNISGSTDNYLHHNNFRNNTRNGYDSTTQLNDWDDGVEGNWWDDYTGFDSNNDGIGDIPYDIPGGGSKDWYPIIKPANITAPFVEKTTPAEDAVNVSVTTIISITFSNKMNKTGTENATGISGGLTLKNPKWSNGDMTVTFAVSSSLSSSTSYTVTITIAAKDVLENHLENTYKFTFTSKDVIPPKMISHSPSPGSSDINLNQKIVVTFSEPMNITTVTYSCSPDPGGWSVAWSVKNSIATYSHTDFGSLTTYTFRITGGKDLGNNDLVSGTVPNPWSFTTKDVVGPEITTTSPSNGSTGVLIDAKVVVTFNEQMNTTSVAYSCTPNPGGWTKSWTNGDKTVSYSHNTFQSQAIYTFQITAGKDIAGNTLNPSLPNPWRFTVKDITPPRIIATSPVNDSYSIPLNANIIVTFSEAMDNTTVTYICNPNPSGWAVVWSGGNTLATYSHNSFKVDTRYTFQVTGGKDMAGNEIVGGSISNPWSFSTQDLAGPKIIATTPTDGAGYIGLNANIVVTFSEKMNTDTVACTCLPDPGGWSVSWSKGDNIATFSHDAFSSFTKYTFQITSGKDLADNNLAAGSTPNPWTFTTLDAEGPAIISVLPEDGKTNVALSANIVVTFSEAMDTYTVTFTCSPNPTGWSIVWNDGKTAATFMHDPFKRSTTYSFKITSGKDMIGNNLVSGNLPNPWSFTTLQNQPPTILSEPPKTATEEIPYSYEMAAFDSDNDRLIYYLTTFPEGMTIHSATGVISWIPTNDQVGQNHVTVEVADKNDGITAQSFTITVTNVNDRPIITSTPVTLALEDTPYVYDLQASDMDPIKNVLRFSLITYPAGMEIDSKTGMLTWVPTNDQVGANKVTAHVLDGNGGVDSQTFQVDVENINDRPIIISTPITEATEDEKYDYDADAHDVDVNDKLTYGLDKYPSGMVIDKNTGKITWAPTNDQVGVIPVTVKVIDLKGDTALQSFSITVINVNDVPIVTSTHITSATVGVEYIYDIDALDIDPTDDDLTFSLRTYPRGMKIDPNTGVITWTPSKDQEGVCNVVVQVSDGNNGTSSQSFLINVDPSETPEMEVKQEKGAQDTSIYNIFLLIFIAIMIVVSVLFIYLKKKKPVISVIDHNKEGIANQPR